MTINNGVLTGGSGTDTFSLDGNVVFNMAKWSAKDAGFESLYNYWGYSISGTGDADKFDFSALNAVSRYGIVLYGLGGDDVIVGTNGTDILSGGDDNDTLTGGTGADTLIGRGGADYFYGGDGDDALSGGVGDDGMTGGVGNDTLSGDTGNDVVDAGDGNDIAIGGDGDDNLYLYGGTDLLASGGAGDDTVHLAGVTVNSDVIVGGSGTDTLAIDGAVTLALANFDAEAAGFENYYNYRGYAISGTATANTFDFSTLTVTSRYGAGAERTGGRRHADRRRGR